MSGLGSNSGDVGGFVKTIIFSSFLALKTIECCLCKDKQGWAAKICHHFCLVRALQNVFCNKHISMNPLYSAIVRQLHDAIDHVSVFLLKILRHVGRVGTMTQRLLCLAVLL